MITDVVNGVLSLASDGSFTYQHDGSETLVDSFLYEARDNIAGASQATVTLTIAPVNDIPTAQDDGYSMGPGDLLEATVLEGVLSNDSDVEGTPLMAVLQSDVTHGVLTLGSDDPVCSVVRLTLIPPVGGAVLAGPNVS